MDRLRRVLTVFFTSSISIALHGQQSIDWDRRPRVDSAALGNWLSSTWFENSVVMFLFVGAAVWVAFLLSAWRMIKEKAAGHERVVALKKPRRFALPVSDMPRIGLDPYGTEGYESRLQAARFSPDSPSSRN